MAYPPMYAICGPGRGAKASSAFTSDKRIKGSCLRTCMIGRARPSCDLSRFAEFLSSPTTAYARTSSHSTFTIYIDESSHPYMKDYRKWKCIGDMSSDMMISSNPKIIARLPGSLQDAPLLLYQEIPVSSSCFSFISQR
jgi:hypothetical protein